MRTPPAAGSHPARNNPLVIEYFGGPLDGTRRIQTDLAIVRFEPVPATWSNDPMCNPEQATLKRSMVYVLQVDGRSNAVQDHAGRYRCCFRGYL